MTLKEFRSFDFQDDMHQRNLECRLRTGTIQTSCRERIWDGLLLSPGMLGFKVRTLGDSKGILTIRNINISECILKTRPRGSSMTIIERDGSLHRQHSPHHIQNPAPTNVYGKLPTITEIRAADFWLANE